MGRAVRQVVAILAVALFAGAASAQVKEGSGSEQERLAKRLNQRLDKDEAARDQEKSNLRRDKDGHEGLAKEVGERWRADQRRSDENREANAARLHEQSMRAAYGANWKEKKRQLELREAQRRGINPQGTQ